MNVIAFLLSMTCTGPPDADSLKDQAYRKAWLEVCESYARDYRIFPAGQRDQPFRMLPEPVFQHAQATRGSIDIGAVWLWADAGGRPGAIGTVFVYPLYDTPYHNMVHEFHSLADGPLVATWRKQKVWEPSEAGLPWKPLSDAPDPAGSARGRLRQLRLLSRRFKAHSARNEGDRWELRLISAPLYRYELKENNENAVALGGALFAFCQGTDPEIILAVEARRAGEAFRWHFACASFSDLALSVRLDDREVWKTSPVRGPPDSPHWGRGFSRLTLPDGPQTEKDQ